MRKAIIICLNDKYYKHKKKQNKKNTSHKICVKLVKQYISGKSPFFTFTKLYREFKAHHHK